MKSLMGFSFITILFVAWAWAQQGAPGKPQPSNQPQAAKVPAPQVPSNLGQPPQSPPPPNTGSPNNAATIADSGTNTPLTSENPGRRDPFVLPLYLINRIKALQQPAVVPGAVRAVDDSIEPVRRWPLVSYTLVGIIWGVKNAKALFKDPVGKVHILKVKDRIGYDKGVVTDIREGSVTVLENQVPQVLKLKK